MAGRSSSSDDRPRHSRRPTPHGARAPEHRLLATPATATTTALLSSSRLARQLEQLRHELHRVVVGQERVLERVLVALLAGGHCLLEGVPGLGKTLTVATLAQTLGGTFHRIQFTPDLIPSDLVGTRIYRPSTERFDVELGPVFANFVLADEINRAPAKVQSALLEVMAERQVSLGGVTYPLPKPFLVLATQNPIESEGVYPLPEAQRDRFLMRIPVDYPTPAEEHAIVARCRVARRPRPSRILPHRRRPRPAGARPPRSTSTRPCRTTRCASCSPRATRGQHGLDEVDGLPRLRRQPPGRPSASSTPAGPSPCSGAATTPCRRTSTTSPTTC